MSESVMEEGVVRSAVLTAFSSCVKKKVMIGATSDSATSNFSGTETLSGRTK
jgi:hypothetical protein